MEFYAEKTVLVTGASSGIGEAIARALGPARGTLLLTARSEDRLAALAADLRAAGAHAHVFAHDLGAPGAADTLADRIAAAGFRVDVLVNNAGYGTIGPFEAANEDDVAGVVRLNAEALTVLARRFAPSMGPGGGILNVASTAAFQPLPYFAVYAATKAYVLSFSEALHAELKPRGVHVTCLCPGPTKTAFGVRAGMAPAFFRGGQTSERVAAVGLRALARNRRVAVSGAGNAVGAFFGRIAPRGPLLAAMGPVFARMHRPS